jgi:hypothetical protein
VFCKISKATGFPVSDGLGGASERLDGTQTKRHNAATGQDSLGRRCTDVGAGAGAVRLYQAASVLGGRGVYNVEPPVAAESHLG